MYSNPMDIYDYAIEEYCKRLLFFSVCGGCIPFQKQTQVVRMMSQEEKWDPLGASLQMN